MLRGRPAAHNDHLLQWLLKIKSLSGNYLPQENFLLLLLADTVKTKQNKTKKTLQQIFHVHEAHALTGIHTDHISIAPEDINKLLCGVFSCFINVPMKETKAASLRSVAS